jgi:hypothetical protein
VPLFSEFRTTANIVTGCGWVHNAAFKLSDPSKVNTSMPFFVDTPIAGLLEELD